jgi:predicted nucleotidyltransferase
VRLEAALDTLSRRARGVDGAAGLVLFGSYARGEFGRSSDVDLLVLARPTPNRPLDAIRSEVVSLTVEAEVEFRLPMHLSVLVADSGTPEELGPELLHALWSEGVVLFAETAALAQLQPQSLAPWVVVRFSASGLPAHHGVRVSRTLYGRGDLPGLVRPPSIRLGRGALLLPAEQAQAVRKALEQIGVHYDVIPVWRSV